MPPSAALPTPERLRALQAQMAAGLLERDTATRLALLASLAGEHLLLIGPPGTAKSALARRLHGAFTGLRWFERLLTRFSTPEELFGPLSLAALEQDRYERQTDGFLPTAGIAFLDEVFRANSAILNALLTLLNEREFDNGSTRARTPLVAVVAASNEVPADDALLAFYDRFLLRLPVQPVGDDNFVALLSLPDDTALAPAAAPIDAEELRAVAAAAPAVALSDTFTTACQALRTWLAARGTPLSDRRWRQWLKLLRTAAATEGRAQLDRYDLWSAPYVAAATPADVPALAAWFEDELLLLPAGDTPGLERAVTAFEKQLEIEQRAPEGEGDAAAGKLALARAIGLGEGSGDGGQAMPRVVSERLQAQLRRHWSALHVATRLAQLGELAQRVAHAIAAVEAASAAQEAALAGRLWMPPALLRRLQTRHQSTLQALHVLAARLAITHDGYAALPVREGEGPGDGEGAAAEAAPAPVAWA